VETQKFSYRQCKRCEWKLDTFPNLKDRGLEKYNAKRGARKPEGEKLTFKTDPKKGEKVVYFQVNVQKNQ